MEKSDLVLMMGYNRWANARVLAACMQMTAEQLAAPVGVSSGSVLGTLAHILSAERIWRLRLQEGVSLHKRITEADFSGLADLAALWQEEEDKMKGFVAGLGEDDLERWVEYQKTNGEKEGNTLWKVLVHVVNHGTQFRGEAGVALSWLGRSPGDLDFILFLREEGKR